jgi:hypothetical protein
MVFIWFHHQVMRILIEVNLQTQITLPDLELL